MWVLVADDPPVGNALLREARQNCSSARVFSDFCEYRNIQPEARHGDGGIDRAAAGVRRNIFRFRLAAFLEEQEGAVGVMQRQALNTLALDHRNRITHGAADGQDFHSHSKKWKPPAGGSPPSRPAAGVGVSYPLPSGAG